VSNLDFNTLKKIVKNNKTKIMKKVRIFNWSKSSFFIGATIAIALIFSGCADLEEDPGIANLAPGSYSNQVELELGVTGMYSQLRNASQWSTFFVAGWGGDDITTHKVSNKADFREFDQRSVSSENARTVGNWRDIYRMVRAANSVLESAEGLELPDQDAQNRLLGEVYFLRGAMFFHLTRVHSRIPLPLTAEPELDISLSSQAEVYAQIESDLMQAESLLPAIYPGVQPGAPRPNSGSASAMLARLYLDWAGFPENDNSKYAIAATKAKQVIDNSASHGFALADNLESLWTLDNRFNSEGVWTIPYNTDNNLHNRKYGKLGNPSDLAGWQETFAEIRFFEDFPEGARKEATYRTEHDWENFTDQTNPVFKKIVGPDGDIPLSAFNTNRNDLYIRYAEVLLIFAEASGRTGNATPDAWEALNQIRRRAAGLPFGTPVMASTAQLDAMGNPDANGLMYVDITSGDLAELTFTERKWELAGEWIRWNDLVRMQRVEAALSQRDPQSSMNAAGDMLQVSNPIIGSLGTDNYFAPIPANEIVLNPNLGN